MINSYDYSFIYNLNSNSWWLDTGIYPYDYTLFNNEIYLADRRKGVVLKQNYSSPVFYDYDANYVNPSVVWDTYTNTKYLVNIVTGTNVGVLGYYYTRKDYLLNPLLKKYLDYFYLSLSSQDLGNFNFSYYIHNIKAKTLEYPMLSNDPSIIKVNRYPRGEQGYYFQWMFYNTDSINFNLYGFSTTYRNKSLEISK
jgi:hypothetical protein